MRDTRWYHPLARSQSSALPAFTGPTEETLCCGCESMYKMCYICAYLCRSCKEAASFLLASHCVTELPLCFRVMWSMRSAGGAFRTQTNTATHTLLFAPQHRKCLSPLQVTLTKPTSHSPSYSMDQQSFTPSSPLTHSFAHLSIMSSNVNLYSQSPVFCDANISPTLTNTRSNAASQTLTLFTYSFMHLAN